MAKEIKATVRLRLSGGAATPAPPVGSMLGSQGVNLPDFCKKFNADTANRKGETVPVLVVVYKDKKFDYVIKTAPTGDLIKKKISLSKGAAKTGKETVGKISWQEIEEIAKIKMPDLNAFDLEQAKKVVAGTARSMGVEVIAG